MPARSVTGSRRGADREASGADPVEWAREVALTALTYRPRTRHDLAGILADKGVSLAVTETVLDRLEQVGLVDDAAFARAWAESRRRSRGLSRAAIRRELRTKGVADDLIDAALVEVSDADEWNRAVALARQRSVRLARMDPDAAARRLVSFLTRRGYAPGLAWSVARDVLAAESVEPDD